MSTSTPLLEIQNLYKHFPGVQALEDVSLSVNAGALMALLGENGAGQSTLVKILSGAYVRDSGVIRVGGVDVRALPVAELRRRVTVVSQDVFLFRGTIADNIRLGLDLDRAALEDAVGRVGADRLLARRGATLDTEIAERGGN